MGVLVYIWQIYYQVNLINGWIVLPLIPLYIRSGKFSFFGKISDALLKYLLVMIYCFVPMFVFIAIMYIFEQENFDFKFLFEIGLSIYNSAYNKKYICFFYDIIKLWIDSNSYKISLSFKPRKLLEIKTYEILPNEKTIHEIIC